LLILHEFHVLLHLELLPYQKYLICSPYSHKFPSFKTFHAVFLFQCSVQPCLTVTCSSHISFSSYFSYFLLLQVICNTYILWTSPDNFSLFILPYFIWSWSHFLSLYMLYRSLIFMTYSLLLSFQLKIHVSIACVYRMFCRL